MLGAILGMLPATGSFGDVKGENDTVDQVDAIRDSAAPFGWKLVLVHRFLRSKIYARGECSPHLRAAVHNLRILANLYGHSLATECFHKQFQLQLGRCNDYLLRIERYLLLQAHGIESVRPTQPDGDAATNLFRLASEVAANLDFSSEVVDGIDSVGGTNSPLEEALRSYIAEALEKIASRANQTLAFTRELIRFARGIEALGRAYPGLTGGPECIELCLEVSRHLREAWEFWSVLSRQPDDDRTDLIVDVRLPAAAEGEKVVLTVTYTALLPQPAVYSQMHYVITDGRSHRYRIDLPEGTTGFASIQMKATDSIEAKVIRLSPDITCGLELERGDARRPYKAGQLFYCAIPGLA